MSCAYFLANMSYPVTVFDKDPIPGGMLTKGIPSFRLEKDIVNAEIDVLREMGVEFKCDVEVGKDVTIPELREQGYKAFYLAIGLQKAVRLNVEGEELDGVIGGIDFLRGVNRGETTSVSGDTVVIGGGNAAIDVGRAATRLGTGKVSLFCLESDEEMPTVPDEKNEAIAEGIEINNCWGPKRIIGENGRVTGVEFQALPVSARRKRSICAEIRRERNDRRSLRERLCLHRSVRRLGQCPFRHKGRNAKRPPCQNRGDHLADRRCGYLRRRRYRNGA